MKIRIFGVNIYIKFSFLFIMAIFFAYDKFYIGRMIILSVFLHEMGHIIMFNLCKAKIKDIVFNPFGISIVYPSMLIGYKKEILCYISGCIVNFFIAFVFYNYTIPTFFNRVIVMVNLVMGFFNLIPIGDLDGGRIVATIGKMFFTPYKAQKFSFYISIIMIIPLFIVSVYIYMRRGNITCIVTSFFLLAKVCTSKIID